MNYFDTRGQTRQQLSISLNCDNTFFIIVRTYSIGMVNFNGHVLKSIDLKNKVISTFESRVFNVQNMRFPNISTFFFFYLPMSLVHYFIVIIAIL
jgi:hypothetical protein